MRARCSGWLLALLTAAPCVGQMMPGGGGRPGMGGMGGMGGGNLQRPPSERSSLYPTWSTGPTQVPFAGFRTPVAPTLRAFGGYPLEQVLGTLMEPGELPLIPFAVRVSEAPDWPRWVRDRNAMPFPFVPEQALLVRHTDRVWVRGPQEDAMVPMYHHDRVRSVVPGTAVEVRHSGEFELMLHLGGQIMSQGPVALQIEQLTPELVSLRFAQLTKLRLQVTGREHHLQLPDGSTVVIPADSAAADPEAPAQGQAQLQFDRLEEPTRTAGRIALWNSGLRTVQWRHAFGEVSIAHGQRVFLLVQAAEPAIGTRLAAQNVQWQRDGKLLRGTSSGLGEVSWSGARFQLPAGASVQLDPLQGDPFAVPATAPAEPAGRKP